MVSVLLRIMDISLPRMAHTSLNISRGGSRPDDENILTKTTGNSSDGK